MLKHCQCCDESFETESKNQIYCSSECRAKATKEKIVQRYRITKSKERIGKSRICAGGCGTNLSIYNNNSFCDPCLVNNRKVDKFLKELKDFFDYEQK
jgi:uncharacterized protein YmfQ (DUF2313 family)